MSRPAVSPSATRPVAALAALGLLAALAGCGARTELDAACLPSQARCAGACTYLASDWMNCGTCGKACPSGQQCRDGECEACPPGQSMCKGRCVDPSADHENCGACGHACTHDQSCIAGRCECRTGETACGETCVATDRDPANCGGCGRACPDGFACVAGSCEAPCAAGREACGGACVDTQTDVDNCGACNITCAATQACIGGHCRCSPEMTSCSRGCVDVRTDLSNCGRCNLACAAGQSCISGQCCPLGAAVCQNTCVDLLADASNCGSCGHPCPSGDICQAGRCVAPCVVGSSLCSGRCVDLTSDSQNCGACGHACAGDETCGDSSCAKTCAAQLIAPVADAWGARFDGLERRLSTFADAKASCEAIGGRLPTATELWRVSANQYGGVGQTYQTNALWSLTPSASDTQITVALSDGTTAAASSTASNVRAYRCECPTPSSTSFDSRSCFGPPAAPCQSLTPDGGHQNIDLYNRAPLPRGAAMWECSFAHGHLPTAVGYMEAIVKGLANGTDTLLHSGDEASAGSDMLVKWSGTGTGWVANASNVSSGPVATFRPFRCTGQGLLSKVKPVTISSEFVPASSLLLGERVDRLASTWSAAHDACWNAGGHLARAAELGELIEQGLPAGSNLWLWSADGLGSNGALLQTQAVRWSGIQNNYFTELNVNPVSKSSNPGQPFRCIWYYSDGSYLGPSSANCSSGCQRLALGSGTALMWFDKFDRAAATLTSAVTTCVNAGGHLASERDLTEAVRHALPNGTSSLHTSDLSSVGMMVVRWTGTDASFTDLGPTYSSSGPMTDTRAFRCVWTNEYR